MPVANPTSIVNALSDQTEVILQDLRDASVALDPFYLNMFTTSEGVQRTGFGRNFEVHHPLAVGVAAAVRWSTTPLGGTPTQSLTHPVVPVESSLVAYPTLSEMALPGTLDMKIDLARCIGNLIIPVEWTKADVLPAVSGTVLENYFQRAAKNILLAELHSFYKVQASPTTPKGIAVISAVIAEAAGTATWVVSLGAISQFHEGMYVDVIDSADDETNHTGASVVVVDKVERVPQSGDTGGYGRISVVRVSGADDLQDVNPTDVIVRKGEFIPQADAGEAGTPAGPLGPEDWMTASAGITLFGLSTTDVPELKSIVIAVNGPFTNTVGIKAMSRYTRSLGLDNLPDTWVTSPGVTAAAVDNLEGLRRFNLGSGGPLTFAQGYNVGAVPFTYNGKNMRWFDSPYFPSYSAFSDANPVGGRAWALKTAEGNLRRYVPATGRFSRPGEAPIPSEVEFMLSGGPMGIFTPARSSSTSGIVGAYEAPFDRWMARAPMHVPAILLTGLSEVL